MSGKGSAPRPFSVSNEEYQKRWDAIFQRDIREVEDDLNEKEAFETIERNIETNKNVIVVCFLSFFSVVNISVKFVRKDKLTKKSKEINLQ